MIELVPVSSVCFAEHFVVFLFLVVLVRFFQGQHAGLCSPLPVSTHVSRSTAEYRSALVLNGLEPEVLMVVLLLIIRFTQGD